MNTGTPNDIEEYDNFETDGITVYVQKDTKTKNDELTISTLKILWVENLVVDGLDY